MKRILINATQQEEIRVAIVDGQKLIDLDIEVASRQRKKGNIYKGLITSIEPSLNAVFVDYGTERNGFLPFKEIARSYCKNNLEYDERQIGDYLNKGQQVLVQIQREERGNKGAALTTYISLAGRYLVLMPNNPKAGGVSRRISGEHRETLQETYAQLHLENDEGMIIRTAGIGRNIEDLQWDLNYLRKLWHTIIDSAKGKPAPFLVYQESSTIICALRDYVKDDIGEVIIDNQAVFNTAKEFVESMIPSQLDKLVFYDDDTPLFSKHQLESAIESAYEREVRLPSGATIVFDHTEALLAIDINSSRATRGRDIEETALQTNLEACSEIARQLRLRDAGGLIVIDFIDMLSNSNQRKVEREIKMMMQNDRARMQIGHISRFGLMEISRQRLRSSLGEVSYIPCPRCSGHGSIRSLESSALASLRMMEEEATKQKTGRVVAHLPVNVTSFLLNEKRNNVTQIEKLYGVEITIVPDIQMETPHFKINRYRKDDSNSCAKPSHEWISTRDYNDKHAELEHRKTPLPKAETPAITSITPDSKPPGTNRNGFFTRFVSFFKSSSSTSEASAPKQESRSRHSQNRDRNSSQRSHSRPQSRTQGRYSQSRGSSYKNKPRRSNDNRSSGNRSSGNRSSDNRSNDNRSSGNRSNDNRFSDNRSSDNRFNDNRSNDNRSSGNRSSDNRFNDNRSSDNRSSGNRSSDNRFNDNRSSDNRSSDNRSNDNRSTTAPATTVPVVTVPATTAPVTTVPTTTAPTTTVPTTTAPATTRSSDNRSNDNRSKRQPLQRQSRSSDNRPNDSRSRTEIPTNRTPPQRHQTDETSVLPQKSSMPPLPRETETSKKTYDGNTAPGSQAMDTDAPKFSDNTKTDKQTHGSKEESRKDTEINKPQAAQSVIDQFPISSGITQVETKKD